MHDSPSFELPLRDAHPSPLIIQNILEDYKLILISFVPVLGVRVKVLVVVGAAGVASMGSGQGMFRARHSCLQPTHRRAQLNPSAMMVAPWGTYI